jgi:hypothetical protein
MIAEHRWETTSSHVTSEGWVRYQRCACGSTRVLLGAEPIGVAAGMIASGAGLSLSDDDHAGDVGRDG